MGNVYGSYAGENKMARIVSRKNREIAERIWAIIQILEGIADNLLRRQFSIHQFSSR
jgi:hypothetical protein